MIPSSEDVSTEAGLIALGFGLLGSILLGSLAFSRFIAPRPSNYTSDPP
jgi:hypothetical protein